MLAYVRMWELCYRGLNVLICDEKTIEYKLVLNTVQAEIQINFLLLKIPSHPLMESVS